MIETLLALFIVGVALAGMARLITLSGRAVAQARSTTLATVLAGQKMEQLRARGDGFDETMAGDALQRNVEGLCDFFDETGRPLGHGTAPPPGSAYVRRWSVERVTGATGSVLVLQVVVRPEGRVSAVLSRGGRDARARGGAHVVWMKSQGAE